MKTNEKVLYDGKRFEKRKVSASRYTCWKEGYLELDDANIMDVLNRIGRYYNLSFCFGDKKRLTGRKCSGKIYLSDNIDNVLTTIHCCILLITGKKNGLFLYLRTHKMVEPME